MSKFTGGNNNSLSELTKAAEEAGCEVVLPMYEELQLDLDSLEAQAQFGRMLKEFGPQLDIVEKRRWISKSGNLHVVLRCSSNLTVAEKIAIQACFGSDVKRELLSLMGSIAGSAYPLVLFRPLVTGPALVQMTKDASAWA